MRCERLKGWFCYRKSDLPTIIVAESDPHTSERMVRLLEGEGANVVTARKGSEAVALCRNGKDQIVLAATDLPDLDAVSFLREARVARNRNLFLMTVEERGPANRAEIIRQGAYEVIGKPIDIETFPLVIRRALAKRSLHLRVDYLKGLTALLVFMIPLMMTAGILLAVN